VKIRQLMLDSCFARVTQSESAGSRYELPDCINTQLQPYKIAVKANSLLKNQPKLVHLFRRFHGFLSTKLKNP